MFGHPTGAPAAGVIAGQKQQFGQLADAEMQRMLAPAALGEPAFGQPGRRNPAAWEDYVNLAPKDVTAY